MRVADRSERPASAGARVRRRPRGRASALHRQAGRRRGPRRQRRQLRRDRADAARPAGRSSSSSCTGSTRRPRACCWSPRRARRWSRCRTTCARARRASDRQDLCGAGRRRLAGESLKVIDVALHKYPLADGSRHVRAVADDDERGRRSISLVRVARALRRLQPARRDDQDRPHAPDPRPPRRCRPCDRRRPEVRRLRAQQGARARPRWSRRCASTACSCTPAPALHPSGERRADRARGAAAGAVPSACSRRWRRRGLIGPLLRPVPASSACAGRPRRSMPICRRRSRPDVGCSQRPQTGKGIPP